MEEPIAPVDNEMSIRTPFVLTGGFALLFCFVLASFQGLDILIGLFTVTALMSVVNSVMLWKALQHREQGLAIIYFILMIVPLGLLFFLYQGVPGKIGG